MKILETRLAPNPRRVRIFLAEKGIEVPFEQVDLMKGDLKTDAFTKLNRLQRVPVMVLDDGTSICESIAICRYFEEL
jgi:glutathione S-transferase